MATYRTSGVTFTTASGTKTVTLTSVTGDLPVIFVANSDDSGTPTVTDDDGGTYTRVCVHTMTKRSSADHGFIFVRDARVASGKSTVYSMAPGTTSGGGLAVILVSGMSLAGASAVRQDDAFQTARAPAGTPAPTFGASCLTGNMILGFVGNASNAAALTPPSSSTERHDVGYGTPTEGLEVITRDSGFTGTTLTWGGTSATAYYDGAIELDTSAAPGFAHSFGGVVT